MKAISLAEKPDMPSMMTVAESPAGTREYFPTVTLRETGGLTLPDDGEITLAFHKIRSEEENHDGKKTYRCTIELREILDVEDTGVSEPASSKSKDSEDALDAIRKEKMDESDEGEY